MPGISRIQRKTALQRKGLFYFYFFTVQYLYRSVVDPNPGSCLGFDGITLRVLKRTHSSTFPLLPPLSAAAATAMCSLLAVISFIYSRSATEKCLSSVLICSKKKRNLSFGPWISQQTGRQSRDHLRTGPFPTPDCKTSEDFYKTQLQLQ